MVLTTKQFIKKMYIKVLVAYSEPRETSKMECFAKVVNGFQPLTIFAKCSILDV